MRSVAAHVYGAALSFGGPGLFLLALLDSSFLSIPEGNDVLIVVLSTGQSWELMAYYVGMTILGSVTGCSLLYSVARRGGAFFERRKKLESHWVERYRRWGTWAIVIPSILPPPTPFKVFVFSAGLLKVPLRKFFTAIVIGRSIRYFMWGILAVLFGEAAKTFLDQHLKTIGLVLFGLLLSAFAGYILVWLRTRKTKQS